MTTQEQQESEKLETGHFESLIRRIHDRTARIGVVGLGYVGLPLAMRFSEEGFTVTGFDINEERVNALNTGHTYISRISPTEVHLLGSRGFRATSDVHQISELDAVLICVPTPLSEHREPDMSYIEQTAVTIAPYLRSGQLVVLESTTYPGTTEEVLIPILETENGNGLCVCRIPDDRGFYVGYSPEREDPGNEAIARCDIPKVLSAVGSEALELASALYGSVFRQTVPVSSTAVAEMTKLLENIYRCVNIALINELKQLCHLMNIDVFEVIEAAKTKPFGFHAFYPGPGLGGHCIPVDPFYLSWKAKQYDFRTKFIELAGEINALMPHYIVRKTAEALNSYSKPLKESKILVLGVAYKRDVDDIRESPALTIIHLLQRSGAHVAYHDPYCAHLKAGPRCVMDLTTVSLETVGTYDCVLIVTDHSDYDYVQIVDAAPLVVDTRNATKGMHSNKIVHC